MEDVQMFQSFINDLPKLLSYVFGYLFSIFVADLIIRPIRRILYSGLEKPNEPNLWRPQILGWLERAIYTSSILAGTPEFVAIWLALKVAEHWERWKQDIGKDVEKTSNRARVSYTGFLIGNALSILCAGAGAYFIHLSLAGKWFEAIGILISLVFFSVIIYSYSKSQVKKK